MFEKGHRNRKERNKGLERRNEEKKGSTCRAQASCWPPGRADWSGYMFAAGCRLLPGLPLGKKVARDVSDIMQVLPVFCVSDDEQVTWLWERSQQRNVQRTE